MKIYMIFILIKIMETLLYNSYCDCALVQPCLGATLSLCPFSTCCTTSYNNCLTKAMTSSCRSCYLSVSPIDFKGITQQPVTSFIWPEQIASQVSQNQYTLMPFSNRIASLPITLLATTISTVSTDKDSVSETATLKVTIKSDKTKGEESSTLDEWSKDFTKESFFITSQTPNTQNILNIKQSNF